MTAVIAPERAHRPAELLSGPSAGFKALPSAISRLHTIAVRRKVAKDFQVRLHDPYRSVEDARVFVQMPWIAWHALRGFDLGSLYSILTHGIMPDRSKGPAGWEQKVSLSANPRVAHAAGWQANSFIQYSLSDSISLAVFGYDRAFRNYGGFQDEVREDFVERSRIKAVMVAEPMLKKKIGSIDPTFEPARERYLERLVHATTRHLRSIGSHDIA